MTQDIANSILARIYGTGRGSVFTPKDFLDISSPDSARQALARLAKAGTIRRLMRGVYDYPAYSKLLQAPARPAPDAIARAVARAHGWTILPTGETALNLLGLSTQVPAQWQYLSDGPSKKYAWQSGKFVFKHRANTQTSALSPKTALLVQALKSLGEERIDDAVLAKLRKQLTPQERARAVREARYVPSWIYEAIKRLAKERETRHA